MMKLHTRCDVCPHAFTEFCWECVYADSRGNPNVSEYDPEGFDEDDETNEE